ncbi:MAG: hypothetical protein LBG12_09640 [Synergistaceae bacterium]|jgi:c-di-AMP phosphodiesterase-like protein|nr:hypothetical protein [Synergistaceae bacterium]
MFMVLKVILGSFGLMILIWLINKHLNLLVVLIVLGFLFGTMVMVLRHRRLKRQQDIDILNADVSKIGDDEAARRAGKYQGK